uniref:Uncharacterized protein n=1 Tax=Vespula pensylvanica TaxID=30213 RepID=A0A834UGR9_VESPE|nr:hypothetical protein H0235_001146 [Vespula pensylvanica]
MCPEYKTTLPDEDGRTYNGIPDNPIEPEINGNSQKCRRRFRLIEKIELSDGIKSFANKRARANKVMLLYRDT